MQVRALVAGHLRTERSARTRAGGDRAVTDFRSVRRASRETTHRPLAHLLESLPRHGSVGSTGLPYLCLAGEPRMNVGDVSYSTEDFLAAWATLYERALGRAIILVGRNDAEDAVQETFVKLWTTWKKSPAKREVIINRSGYTFTALRRTCIDL